LLAVSVRLAHLQAAENVQLPEPVATAFDRREVAGGVERRWRQHPVRVSQRGEALHDVWAFQRDAPRGVIKVLGDAGAGPRRAGRPGGRAGRT
jgi:hypothetical protein